MQVTFFFSIQGDIYESFHLAGARKLTEKNLKPVMKQFSSHYKCPAREQWTS